MGVFKINKTLLVLVLFVLLASFALADVAIVEDNATINVDYANFNDEDQTTLSVSASTLTIQNNDAADAVVTIAVTGLASGYKYDNEQVTILAGTSISKSLNIKVPHKEAPGEKQIGTVTVSINNVVADSATLIQKTANMMKLKEVVVDYTNEDGSTESDDFDSSDGTYDLKEKVRPGTEMTLTFKIDNRFDNKYDDRKGTLEEVTLEIQADDDDIFADDFEEDHDLSDIDMDDDIEYEVTFMLDEDVDAGDYELEITIKSEDGENVKYRIDKKVKFDIERQRNDVRVKKAVFSPDTVSCEDDFVLDLAVKNYGTRDQKHAALSIVNSELGINEKVNDFPVDRLGDRDDTFTQSFPLTLKKGTKAKTYQLDLNVYYDLDKSIDHQRVALIVEKCVEEPVNIPDETESEPNNQTARAPDSENNSEVEADTTGDKISSYAVVQSVEDPYTIEDFIIAAIVVVVVFLLALIVVFVVMLLK